MAEDIIQNVEQLNADGKSAVLDRAALDAAISVKGAAFKDAISAGHENLYADVPVFITPAQLRKMYEVISAVQQITSLPGWREADEITRPCGKGVFYGFDFHLNEQDVHLIEINTNAGGAFLNDLLIGSQSAAELPGKTVAVENLEAAFLAMFRNEWRLERGSAPLASIAIVDEQPEQQYLYPEFLLAKDLFERDGLAVYIADPSMLRAREDGVYFGNDKIDMIYNRLTDFSLKHHPALLAACTVGKVVLTPSPQHFTRYSDKRNLARLTDAGGLRSLGASEADIAVLQAGIPHTFVVQKEMADKLWAERKNLFFKPDSGYGSKGAYRGANLTKRVFADILEGGYVAQLLAPPGERAVCINDNETVMLKYDLRCYAYDGKIQLVAARMYQGQTTNFRTPGGGFAMVRVVE